jgi:ABC-type maltose transport system permease subunit
MHDLLSFDVPRIIWFDGFVGRLGYSSYDFPQWVNNLALWIAGGLVVLAGVTVVRLRAAVRARWMEVLVYVTMVAGVMGAVGLAIYRLSSFGQPVAQARYLLPLLPVYAAIIALASRAGGRRFGPAIAAAIVVTMSAHGFAAVMLSLHQYYT